MSQPLVVGLGDSTSDAGQLGGKGASLGRLVQLGHRVPPGFVVTVAAFETTLSAMGLSAAHAELSRSVSARSPDWETAAAITRGLQSAPLPDEVWRAIEDEIARQQLWETTQGGLIVRSSATVEDSAVFSFAGIFESMTVEAPDSLESVTRSVWASAFSRRALSYAADSNVGLAPGMAIVIQVFLDASRSGVMFTTFGGSRALVEHVEGGCEKLVKGEVIPDRLWIDRVTGAIEGDGEALEQQHVKSLSLLAQHLEQQFAGPQDVEWVIHGDAVHLLQTRPITAGLAGGAAGDTAGAVLTGVAASQGVGTGDVHLVFNIDHALDLKAGQVLVTPMTNPDMVVAMRNSSAIVTDVGGMICHAAIVSRELGLPCVVGTETATRTLAAGQLVTVDGFSGAVYDGIVAVEDASAGLRPAEWEDVWEAWIQAVRTETPLLSSVAALDAAPSGLPLVMLRPEIDLRADDAGLWADLEHWTSEQRAERIGRYVVDIERIAGMVGTGAVVLVTDDLPPSIVEELVVATCATTRVRVGGSGEGAAPISVALVQQGEADPRHGLVPMAAARAAARDTLKFFGHQPGVKRTTMPNPDGRAAWWELLPEYGRFHREAGTAHVTGEHDWLEVRPELVISALLKSLVQPGFEMVPRVMGFPAVPPLHIKWVRCRYHFRSDVFATAWEAIVEATWDTAYMADLMHRVRVSYDQLAEVLVLFPTDGAEIRRLSGSEIVALITSWWPRWVEFFALCWFIQAQGDDILYPFIDETVAANLAATGRGGEGVAWPTAGELVLPTTSVLSGEYMASMGRLHDELIDRNLATPEAALRAIQSGKADGLADMIDAHLREWHWMRDRDLMFEPWDTPQRVVETALQTEPHAPADYAENRRRNLFALAFHSDLAEAAGRRGALNHAVRFLHDLNVERENHHVLWLKYSYPLRRLFLEIQRRLIELGSLADGDIWFLQTPELLAAARNLPEPLPAEVVARVRNRRRGFEVEARFSDDDPGVTAEDDYY